MQSANATLSDPRWAALVARDAAADGQFYYSVRTTGVYCRPSCKARLPRPENVQFHATCAAAEAAGFRACKRCRPADDTSPHAAAMERVIRRMETADHLPPLAELAAEAGLSPFHFHRVFKAATGLTPRAFAAGRRASRVREALAAGESVTAAVYESGYNSSGRFYQEAGGTLGMKPSQFRGGGRDASIVFAVGECDLGSVLVARSERGICSILLGEDPDALVCSLQDQFPHADLKGGDAAFEQLVAKVVGLVQSPAKPIDLPLDIRGTVFQQRVWQALRQIPPGDTASYSDIADRIGAPGAVRAVARACAQNVLAVAIPCHRVVRQDGALSGYRWGVERKRALLDREAAT